MLRYFLLIAFVINVTKTSSHRHRLNYNINNNEEVLTTSNGNDGVTLDEAVVVDTKTGIKYNPYSKNHPGRRVCTGKRDGFKSINVPDDYLNKRHDNYNNRNKRGNLYNMPPYVYNVPPLKMFYDTITGSFVYKSNVHYCCPGWTQVTNRSHGCNKPHCTIPCQNGGVCTKPERCNCPKGFSGNYCEDVNECELNKPCDQMCRNTYGSFKCECREDFVLQSDGQSCKREGNVDVPIEGTDIEFTSLDHRILKLENMFRNSHQIWADKRDVNKIANNVENVIGDINVMKNSLQEMINMKNDISTLRDKIVELDKKRHPSGDETTKTLKLIKGCTKYPPKKY